MKKSPYSIIKYRLSTEKSKLLEDLKNLQSNSCLKKCQKPKYVFVVNPNAGKQEIRLAIEEIYKNKKIKVTSVNTITVKPKPRMFKGRYGKTKLFKKAIVTLAEKQEIDEQK